ncbi:ABC transporter ATP-binding protein [Desulfallas sp. Bu1-1]|uniref:ABC transporter ATP-binding protein n=1 Tax=Desulfallas sp. Bu1-1 TaxID=2787620 RepID=UPI00189D17BB|nr:ABC transporter ATP-binding protein [Desulfallas sp. Bu1-1]MBF7083307.1 ABC transporter ATP-binding protein [Desulfallas sp. Bu1-1]
MLEVKDLDIYYGLIKALHGISFEVKQGEIVTLIGANGAGKSTTLRTISSLIKPKAGTITFEGRNITGIPPHKIVEMGLSHVPEGRKVIGDMTVLENLRMGAYTRRDKGEIAASLDEVFTRFPRLKERAKQLAGTLSGGEQQMLAIGRGMMSKPKLLLLDEPSMGLSPILVEEIFSIISTINSQGTTILLVEQNAFMALQVAHRAYVLETGRVVLSGDARELQQNEKVRSAYLGEIA